MPAQSSVEEPVEQRIEIRRLSHGSFGLSDHSVASILSKDTAEASQPIALHCVL